jgi:hypothetical protein
MLNQINKNFFLFCFIFFIKNYNIQHTNFFEPYEFLLDINRLLIEHHACLWQFNIRGEFGFNFRGYPIDTKDTLLQNYNCKTIKTNPAQYLNIFETDLAAFLGTELTNNNAQFAQQFNPYTGSTSSQLLIFKGNIELQSMTGSIEMWLTKQIKIGYYCPIYNFHLTSLSHESNNKEKYFENAICPDIYKIYQKNGNHISPYQIIGLGDSELLISWQNYFYENRDFISGLFTTLRAGLYLPTGMQKESYLNTFLKIPLGYDTSWGIPFGASIEIDIGCYGGAGISADCITFFPKLMTRIIKTDMRQTDMLALNSSLSLLSPGFKESFSIYLIAHDIERSFLTTIAYQYNKQNESDIILCDTKFSNLIAQTSELLENWTNHNFIFNLQGQYKHNNNQIINYAGFVKFGFYGCRSIVCDSIGFQIIYSF